MQFKKQSARGEKSQHAGGTWGACNELHPYIGSVHAYVMIAYLSNALCALTSDNWNWTLDSFLSSPGNHGLYELYTGKKWSWEVLFRSEHQTLHQFKPLSLAFAHHCCWVWSRQKSFLCDASVVMLSEMHLTSLDATSSSPWHARIKARRCN